MVQRDLHPGAAFTKERTKSISTPAPTAPSGPLPNVGLGDDCQYAHCTPMNSACVTKADLTRTCECVNQYVELKMKCEEGPVKITNVTSITVAISPSQTGQISTVQFTGLGGFPPIFFPTTNYIIPNDGHIQLQQSDTSVAIVITKSLPESASYGLYLSATSRYGHSSVDQIVPVSITVNRAYTTKNITTFVTDRTRKNTFISSVKDLGFESGSEEYTYSIVTNHPETKLMFTIEEESGRVFCRQDIKLTNVVAEEFIFDVKATTRTQSDIIVAHYNVLVLRDQVEMSIEENLTRVIAMYILQSSSFEVNSDNLPPDIEHDKRGRSFKLTSERDYEIQKSRRSELTLSVATVDKSRQTSLRIILNIIDVNDEEPIFSRSYYTFDILAGSLRDSVVGVVQSRDPDTIGSTTYTIVGQHSGMFMVEPSGAIKSKTSLEKKRFGSNFNITVRAFDGERTSNPDTVVNVNLITLPHNDWNITQIYNVTIVEEEKPGTVVTNVNIANYSNFHFLSKRAEMFSLNPKTGVISTTRRLDREKEFAVTAYDIQASQDAGDQCNTEVIGRLHYTIQDINDNFPRFDHDDYTGHIKENALYGTDVSELIIGVTDDDIGANANITLSIHPDNGIFEIYRISSSQYKIRLMNNTLDREVKAEHTLNLTATDNPINFNERNTNFTTLVITVLDENDNSPVFAPGNTSFSLFENDVNQSVTTFTATDADEGINAEVTYILNGGYGDFDINMKTGELWCKGNLDREVHDKYHLTILATDGGFGTFNAKKNITIFVDDKNDNDPVFYNHMPFLSFKRPEDQNCSSLNITIEAKDPDIGVNGAIRFSLNSTEFAIDPDTGIISCTSMLDYETEPTSKFVVIAKDGGAPARSSSVTVEVIVLDINDNSPTFSQTTYNNTISANEWRKGRIVFVARVSDNDSDTKIILSLDKYNDIFDITSGNKGVVSIKSDSHSEMSYSFNITANDNGQPPMFANASVIINVGQDKRGSVRFNSSEYSMNVEENSNCSNEIGKVSVNGEQTVNYTLLEGFTDAFEINQTSGSVKCLRTLDREEMEKHTLVVRATSDTENGEDVTIVTIHVTDVNDNDPEFELDPQRLLFQIEEDVKIGHSVTTLRAVDKDAKINACLNYYIVDQGASTDFKIDKYTGVLTTVHTLDREIVDKYVLAVKVQDQGTPQRTSNTTVKILLTDINDNAPTFTKKIYTASVKENATNGMLLTSVNASDPDYMYNGTVTYNPNLTNLMTNNTNCPFQILSTQGTAGLVTVSAQLDYENTSAYECLVSAVDMVGCEGSECDYRNTGTAIININILDYNDNAPQFLRESYSVNISRDAEIGSSVTDVINATDEDTIRDGNGVVTFSIPSGNEFFNIHNSTGEIILMKPLAQFGRDDLNIIIEAKDNPLTDKPLSSTVTMKINILDDNPRPLFPKKYSFHLTEEEEPNGKTLRITANDIKQGNVTICNCTYKLLQTVFSDKFNLNPKTAELKQVSTLNRERTTSKFDVSVEATDDGNPQKSVTTNVTIYVKDINDNRPYFKNETLMFHVNQTVSESSVIGVLEAVDDDEDSELVFNALDVDDKIRLYSNGTITVEDSLVNHQRESYQIKFTVSVSDNPPFATSPDTNKVKNHLAVVVININYYDPNRHAPVFTKSEYTTSLDFNSKKNTEIAVKNFKAEDLDKDGVSYHITHGNVRDIIRIKADTGQMYLNYDVDDSIGSSINLTVAATDNASYPQTGTCSVLIILKDTEPTQCITRTEYSHLGEESKQKTTFLALFGLMVVLLTIAVITVVILCYKWRREKKQCEQSKVVLQKHGLFGETIGYDRVSKTDDVTEDYRHVENRDFYEGVVNDGYITADIGASKRRQPHAFRPPSEPAPDYDMPDDLDIDDIHLNQQRRHRFNTSIL